MDSDFLTSNVISKLYEFVVACEECNCLLYIPELKFYRTWLKGFFDVELDDNNAQNTEENTVGFDSNDQQDVKMLENFIKLIEKESCILHIYDLYFYKQWIYRNGGKIPSSTLIDTEEPMMVDFDQFNFHFDFDLDDMGEMSEEDQESSYRIRDEALAAEDAGEFEKALELFSKALKMNPASSNLYAKRAKLYLKMKKPVMAINDSTKSIKINQDSSLAYRIRGKAYLMLAIYDCAYNDLTTSCQLDFDEETSNLCKRIEPIAKKLMDYRRSIMRTDREREYADMLPFIKLSKSLLKIQVKNEFPSKPDQDGEPMGVHENEDK